MLPLGSVDYVTLEQVPKNDISKKDWTVEGLFQLRALICFNA